ncbi:hypothetical protein SVIOM342S_01355 [Streptomyces violaceorubidus]
MRLRRHHGGRQGCDRHDRGAAPPTGMVTETPDSRRLRRRHRRLAVPSPAATSPWRPAPATYSTRAANTAPPCSTPTRRTAPAAPTSLVRAVQVAADLGAHAVHCFSRVTPQGTDEDTAWKRLAEALAPVLDAAATAGVPLAVEPEPGHLLATLADFHTLRRALGDPGHLGLTLDIGHCQCLEPLPSRRLRARRRPLAAPRTDRGHAPRRPRTPPLR